MRAAGSITRPVPNAALARRAAVAIGLLLAGTAPGFAAAVDFSFGAHGSQGEFGGAENIRLYEAPLRIVVNRPTSRFILTVPWVRIERTGTVVLTADGPAVLGIDEGGAGRPSLGLGPARTTESGPGDIVLKSETYLSRAGRGRTPWLVLALDLKLSTADEDKGLGTGERDWGAGFDYVQPLGSGQVWQFLLDGTYRFTGDPEGVDLNNRIRLQTGFAAVVRRVGLRVLYERTTPLLDDVPVYSDAGAVVGTAAVDDRRAARFDVTVRSPLGGTTRIGVIKGFGDGSEDLGLLLEFSTGVP